jgi:hypothetical protein
MGPFIRFSLRRATVKRDTSVQAKAARGQEIAEQHLTTGYIVSGFAGHPLQRSILASLLSNLQLLEWEVFLVSGITELQMFLAARASSSTKALLLFETGIAGDRTSTFHLTAPF